MALVSNHQGWAATWFKLSRSTSKPVPKISLAPWLSIVVLYLFGPLVWISADVQAKTPAAHEVKAIFLYNFANFIRWPNSAFADSTSPIRYCVVSKSLVVGRTVREAIRGEVVKGRRLVFQNVNGSTELGNCHVLFISSSEGQRLGEILRVVETHAVLTVSDLEDFISKGGMIKLGRKKRRIHPTINMDAVARAQLQVSSKLLRLATIIHDTR